MAERTCDPRHRLPGAVVPATRDWERTTFGPFGRRVLRAIAESFFTDPHVDDARAPARFDWLVDDVDDFLSQASPSLRTGSRIALVLLEHLPLFLIGKLSRASSLSLEDRTRYLEKVEASNVPYVALLCVMFKTLMTVLYFEHPEAAPLLGHDGRHERFRRVSQTRALPVAQPIAQPVAQPAARAGRAS